MSVPPIPPLAKGALVTVSSTTGSKSSIAFQYNPETVRRTLEANTVGGTPGSRSRVVRFAGAPVETLTLDCRFAAADAPNPDGIAPQLAALALLIYPSSSAVLTAQSMLDAGSMQVVPPAADQLLFVFGGTRVVPVQLTSFAIVEELYDAALTPVLATVTVTLRALSYSDVDATAPAFTEFIAYQQSLERLAAGAITAGGPGGGP